MGINLQNSRNMFEVFLTMSKGPVLVLALAASLLVMLPAPDCQAQQNPPDEVFGNMREGMDMGTDPDTGDQYMRVTPPPRPAPDDSDQPIIIVRPELEYDPPAKPAAPAAPDSPAQQDPDQPDQDQFL